MTNHTCFPQVNNINNLPFSEHIGQVFGSFRCQIIKHIIDSFREIVLPDIRLDLSW